MVSRKWDSGSIDGCIWCFIRQGRLERFQENVLNVQGAWKVFYFGRPPPGRVRPYGAVYWPIVSNDAGHCVENLAGGRPRNIKLIHAGSSQQRKLQLLRTTFTAQRKPLPHINIKPRKSGSIIIL